MTNIPLQSPQEFSYAQILQTIGEQLKNRKGLIFRRVAFSSFPLILAFVLLVYSGGIKEDFQLSDSVFMIYLIVVGILCVFSFIWAVTMNRIFKIERAIWLDSFFDNQPLTTKQSWQLAKELFWQSLVLSLQVFLRYYLGLALLWVILIVLYGFLISQRIVSFDVLVFILGAVLIPISFAIYFLIVKLKLRYLMFAFLDSYQTPNFTYSSLFREVRNLNKVTRGDSFKKTLVTMLSLEATENLTNIVAGYMVGGMSYRLNNTGKAAGSALGLATSEVAAAYRSYAEEITIYIYYRLGRSVIHDDVQTTNNGLYSLIMHEK